MTDYDWCPRCLAKPTMQLDKNPPLCGRCRTQLCNREELAEAARKAAQVAARAASRRKGRGGRFEDD